MAAFPGPGCVADWHNDNQTPATENQCFHVYIKDVARDVGFQAIFVPGSQNNEQNFSTFDTKLFRRLLIRKYLIGAKVKSLCSTQSKNTDTYTDTECRRKSGVFTLYDLLTDSVLFHTFILLHYVWCACKYVRVGGGKPEIRILS